MAKAMSISVVGVPQALAYFATKNAKTKAEVKKGIVQASVYLQGEVKQSIAGHRAEPISVDTGRFLNSIGFQTSDTDGEIFTKLPYGPYLEYGTNFKNSPRKHFRNSAARSADKIQDILKANIKNI